MMSEERKETGKAKQTENIEIYNINQISRI